MKELSIILSMALLLVCGACTRSSPSEATADETALDELQEHLERTAVPDTRTPQEKLSELDGVIEQQAGKVREAEARLARAQTQREIEQAQEDVRIQEHILNNLKERRETGSPTTKSTLSSEAAPSAAPSER